MASGARWIAAILLVACPSRGAQIEGQLRHDGRRRGYVVHVPAGVGVEKPAPLVIVLHGGFGQGKGALEMTRFDAAADRHKFIAAAPNGVSRSWNAGRCCGPAMKNKVDDAGFLSALIDKLSKDFRIDPKRVYATGMSNGAMMSYRLACELSGRIAAIGPVAATMQTAACSPSRPVPVIHFHGTSDPRAPYAGGPAGGGFTKPRVDSSVADVMEFWRKADRCSGKGKETFRRGAAGCVSYAPCAGGAEVLQCTIAGGGHSWPGGPPHLPRILGTPSPDIDATEEIWRFFAAHPLP